MGCQSGWQALAGRSARCGPTWSAFRRGYTGAGGDDLTSDPTDLAVCLGFAAAFLLQRTMASALQAAVLPPLGLAALHLARQLLLRPNEIREALL